MIRLASRRLGATPLGVLVGLTCAGCSPSPQPAPALPALPRPLAQPANDEQRAPSPLPDLAPATRKAPSSENPHDEPVVELKEWATLPIEGFEPAVVSIPAVEEDAPLMVVTHGAGGTADWHCKHWRVLTHAKGYLLCLAGKRMISDPNAESGYYYPDHWKLLGEIRAGLAAFPEAFPLADVSAPVFAGYSQGASMGALAVVELAPTFATLVLIEGGFAEWNLSQAKRFRDSGGKQVLFVCGRRNCMDEAKRASFWLVSKGVKSESVLASGAGHTPAGGVAQATAERLSWLWQDDPRWLE